MPNRCLLLPTAADAQAAGSRDVARPTAVADLRTMPATGLTLTAAVPEVFDLHFDHATLLVTDLARSAAFIEEVLHLEPLETPWGAQAPIRFYSLGGGRQLHVGITQRPIEPDRNAHLAFAVHNFDAYLQFLTERGIPFGNFAGTSNWIEVNDAAHPPR